MEWVPVVFVTFKALVLGTGMYFAIKWHFDQEKKEKKRALLGAGGKVAAVFVLAVLALGLVTFILARKLGLDLNVP